MNADEFVQELNKINIYPTPLQLEQLEKYYNLLIEYNKKINLTGITKKEDVYLKHFYDSLTICKLIDLNNNYTLCDIGTGAGFPGLVLKIIFPNLKVTLVDCLNKRINFLNTVIKELKLNKINTINERIEEYGKNSREIFDIVTARAVAPLNVLLEYAIPVVKVNGYFIPLKGNLEKEPNYTNALAKLKCIIEKKEIFNLPKENSHRELLLIKKILVTKKIFPRNNSLIQNKPL